MKRLLSFLLLFALPIASRAADVPISVLDVAERTLDNRPALAVILSTPLDPKRRYDDFLTVTTANKQTVNGAWVLSDNRRLLYFPHIQPETRYTVSVRRGLPAANGTILAAIVEKEVTTRKIGPAFGFASNGSVLPAVPSEGLPIMSVNVPDVEIEFLRVKEESLPHFFERFNLRGASDVWTLRQIQNVTESVYSARFVTGGQPNTRTVTKIPVQEIKYLKQPGLYIAVMRRPGEFSYNYKTTHYVVTDIGLHARLYKNGMAVFATSLLNGQAMADVAVEVLDKKGQGIKKVFTDVAGVAKFDLRPNADTVLVARKGQNLAVLPFRGAALDLSEFDISGAPQRPLEAFVYSGRDLYRPGEKAQFSILLRDFDGRAVAASPLSLKLKQPDGKDAESATASAGASGYYSQTFTLPSDAATGNWSLEVRADPASREPLQVYRFHVEEFLPERMKLDLTSEQITLKPDEEFAVTVKGAYLYGAPAAGNRFSATLVVRPDNHPLAAFKDFWFGDVNEEKTVLREELEEVTLDASGNHKLELKPTSAIYNSPMRVKLTGSVFESGGRPVTRSIERPLWSASTLVGVRPLYKGDYAESNSTAEFELINAAPDGTLKAARQLEAKVIREDRDYYWEYSEDAGWHYRYSEAQYPILVQNLNIAQSGRARLTFPVEWGSYRLEVTDPDTGRTTRFRFRAGWNWRDQAGNDSARPDKVNLVLDKPGYRVGDTINLKVVAPHAGFGMILVESDQLLMQRRITVPAQGTTVTIPIPPEWKDRHDIYISAVVVRPGSAKEKLTINRAVGLVHLPLERSDRRLDVALSLPVDVQPETRRKVKVRVANAAAKPANLTLSAVDVGVLNITRFERPDPLKAFFGKRRYGIDSYDQYGKVIESTDGIKAKLRFGADDDAGGLRQSKRDQAKVNIVSLFSGPVTVNDKGEAEVELSVPDFNGALRVTAVAYTDDRFGAMDQEMIVAAPVVAELSAPRFLTAGDNTRITLDLSNRSGKDQTLKVRLQGVGPAQIGDGERSVTLAKEAKTVLQFPLTGADDFGVVKLQLEVQGDGVALKRQWELAVRPAYPGERVVHRTRIEPNTTFTFPDLGHNALMPKTVEAQWVVSPVPPLNIGSAMQGLLTYPYGCLEQTTSSTFPLIYVDEAGARRAGIAPLTLAERAKRVSVGIDRLRGMQLSGGGFSLWSRNGYEEPWLTAYASHFLVEAREQGFTVPEDMLQSALENLQKRLQGSPPSGSSHDAHERFAANAYAGYVLARVNRAPLAALRNLYDYHREKSLSGLPLVHLGLALRLQGDARRADEALALALQKPRANEYLHDYGSPIRDTALIVALLNQHKLLPEAQGRLVFDLANQLNQRRWLSTQEQLAVFLAAFRTDATAGDAWQGNIIVGDQRIASGGKGRVLHRFSLEQLQKGIRFESKYGAPLFAELELTGYGKQAPAPRQDKVQIQRTWLDMKGKPIGDRPLNVGEMLLVRLEIQPEASMNHALVVDLLPAGLEVENLNLTQGETLADVLVDGVSLQSAMSDSRIQHQEYRDDRYVAALRLSRHNNLNLFYLVRVVSPGNFVVPPPFVEDMYDPELRGIGVTPAHVVVENRPQ